MTNFKSQERLYLTALFIILSLKLVLMAFVVLHAQIGLGPDEAQYWTWSRQLDFGYYSKPPGIAWEIWAGTSIFGQTELGVRFGALVLGTLLSLAVYALARAVNLSVPAAFWAAMAFAWSPLGMMASFLAITDGGMVLFWTIAAVMVVSGLKRGRQCSYYALGVCIACGALFKWLTYEFWVVAAVIAFFLPAWRSWHLLGGVAVSLLGLLPSIVWSAQHEWATFRHVGATIWSTQTVDAGTTELVKGNFWEFLGAQAVLLSPLLFILFLAAVAALWRRRREAAPALLLCGFLSFGFIAVYALMAVFKKMQGNWVDFAYPAAAVLTAWYAWDVKPCLRGWLIGGVALSAVLCACAFSIPIMQAESFLALPYKYNPFRHNMGGKNLGLELTAAGYDPLEHFLVADKYQTTSLLSFYGPAQKRAYFLNVLGIRKNQFSYWPGLEEEQPGRTGFFVVIENTSLSDPKWELLKNEYSVKLAVFFDNVRYLGVRPLFYAHGNPVKGAMLFKVSDYNGQTPEESGAY